MKTVYVVTNPELGWDCVIGVYEDKDFVYKEFSDSDMYVIHTRTIIKKG